VDAEGVYDPRQLNDRLLLGLKGTMSEAELGWIRQRAHEGLLAKARRGALILGLPVGYVQTRDGRMEKHPDQRVQAAIALVFEKFTACDRARRDVGRARRLAAASLQHLAQLPQCKFSVKLRHLFSAGLRHLPGHCLREGQSRSRREGECYQPWREARSSS
jgi:hypothetical protein